MRSDCKTEVKEFKCNLDDRDSDIQGNFLKLCQYLKNNSAKLTEILNHVL